MSMPDSKYDDMLLLLEELRENRGMEIDYDPAGHQEKRRNEELELIEKELDKVFANIYNSIICKDQQ